MNDVTQKLSRLQPHERRVAQTLALFWEPINVPELALLIKQLGLNTPEGRAYMQPQLTQLRNGLMQQGILLAHKGAWGGSSFQLATPELREHLTREACQETWFTATVQTIQTSFNLSAFSRWYYDERYTARLLRDYRLSIYQCQLDVAAQLWPKIVEVKAQDTASQILRRIFSNPLQKEFLSRFDPGFQVEILLSLFADAIEQSASTQELWDYVREHKLENISLRRFALDELLYQGQLTAAKEFIGTPDTLHQSLASGVIALWERDFPASVNHFTDAIKLWKKLSHKKKGYPPGWQMFLYGLALYKTDEARFYAFAEEFAPYAAKNYPEASAAKAVSALAAFMRNNEAGVRLALPRMNSKNFSDRLAECLAAALIPSLGLPDYTKLFLARNEALGYHWLTLELHNLLSGRDQTSGQAQRSRAAAVRLQDELGFAPLGQLIPPAEEWERVLRALAVIAASASGATETRAKVNETRVAWQLDFKEKSAQPLEQTYGKNGWSQGRNIALKRLFEGNVKNMTEQDIAAVKASLGRERDYSYYGGDFYEFSWDKLITGLVGHPHLFLQAHPGVNIQLTKGEPALVVRKTRDGVELSFDTKFAGEGCLIRKETETRYQVLTITSRHVQIAASLQHGKLQVPARGREALLQAIQPLSAKIAVQSDLEEHFENLPLVETDPRLHALITPAGEGFHLEFFVKPFGTIPPYFKPGKGHESVITELNGKRTRAKRNLKNERALLNAVESACPFLAEFESQNYEWNLENAESCLQALSEMEGPRQAGELVVEWTKGQKLKLLGNVGFGNLALSVRGAKDWFEVSGEARVNEDLVLSLRELLNLSNQTGKNFIELSDGQFIALTEKLRRHLQSLQTVMDDKNRLHNLRGGILADFAGELDNFTADKSWKAHLARLKKAQKFTPALPHTFEAELRPYQTEGYFWLSRLAQWGVGACLADDMGLGKTLMALAVLLERAEQGPALVVAPVSVCRNWVKEARRFAPTLNLRVFGGGDRKSMLEGLGHYDVVVVSYNLLQVEEALFTGQKWATIVLDEAQAIKNRHTKRSQAVMALTGDFRFITTGTPVENHLGELWNLFNFLNPGLLGSHEFFNEKFAVPIEKNQDENARKTLQKLIKPFLLRRRKNQVLDDLPEKTEILLTVEMSAQERAFYEALRREALEKIGAEAGEAKDKRFRILAELTRLRLACCHPRLVNADIPLGSSKLELFGEVLQELLDNKHRALVFSQFVKHLALAEAYLKDKGIAYQYLDGSTPPAARQERIDKFQRGQGEVFLISLKAGGTGLNLTAADYVIHLDPWWNPAVEDQATDRAHRIGQQRPVTVYRLVTENTVEEKILKLHATKRDLADSLLEGTDSSGKLSAEDLLTLISEV